MRDDFSTKRVADPIHGTIGLSAIECQVLDTAVFRRLRNIKQLGLAHYVYPGADYSRLSHSLGVCHVTGRILESIRKTHQDIELDDRDFQKYRLAALLHDIGHYPFSHAMEHAIAGFYSGQLVQQKTDSCSSPVDSQIPQEFYNHERVGQEILEKDKELNRVLREDGFEAREIYSIFNRQDLPKFANLVSSDLDADRIDYLLRTAHHTGLPYGTVDLDYLLSQLRIDSDDKICITDKALRTADHFLLCRLFDYQQVSFHKTVAALELVLKDVLKAMLQEEQLDGSGASITQKIESSEWQRFDDLRIFEDIRSLARKTDDEITRQKAEAILERIPPKLVWQSEFLGTDDQLYKTLRKSVLDHVERWASHFQIDTSKWYVWTQDVTLTKVGSHVPISEAGKVSERTQDKIDQQIRIYNPSNNTSAPIVENKKSLMSILGDHALYSIRVYVLLRKEEFKLRGKIENRIRADLES